MVAFTGADQIYRKDTASGRLDVVSSAADGEPADAYSDYPTISGTGRYVAFASTAANLVPDDVDTWPYESDVFVKDLATGTVSIASVNSLGIPANQPSGYIHGTYYDQTVTAISDDGRYVAFTSDATNLVPLDTNGLADVFVRDLQTGETSRVSVTTLGTEGDPALSGGDNGSTSPVMSADGRYVAFTTTESLDPSDVNHWDDVYVRDRQNGTTTLISRPAEPLEDTDYYMAWSPAISDDGRYVAFDIDIGYGAASALKGIHVWDRVTGLKEHETSNDGDYPGLSGDGEFLIYQGAGNLVYRLNRVTGETIAINKGCFGALPNTSNEHGWQDDAVSADGSRVAFWSRASNIVAGDLNGGSDVFVWDAAASDADNPQCFLDTKSMSYGQTWGRGLHSVACTVCRGDPVNTATGNLTEVATDLSVPGPGLPFRLTRTYNSADSAVGPMGKGWTHSYAASLTELPDSSLQFRAEDGAQLNFMPDGNGGYQALSGARSSLSDDVGGGHKLLSKSEITYRFDADGKLTSLKDRNGNEVSLSYASGQLSSVTDSAGRTITFSYNANGHLASASLPDGRSVQYGYTNGLLTSVTDARGNTRTYGYDASDRLDEEFDQEGDRVMHSVYGSDGRVVSQTDARGKTSTFAWDPTTQKSTMTDPRGELWTDFYSNNLLQRQVDPLGSVQRYDYDEELNIKKVVDERGNSTTMTYDERGNMLSRAAPSPLSYEETWTYNGRNDVITHVDGNGNPTTFDYDANGNLISQTGPGNTVTTYGRDPATGQLISTTDPRGKTTEFDYDADGNLVRITTPMGFKTEFGYDSTGRRTSMIEARGNEPGANPANHTWIYGYNAGDQITSITDPLGNSTTYAYDLVGNLENVTDDNNHTTGFAYNAAKDLLSVSAPDLTVTGYGYDANGNLTTRTNAENHVTTYTYDDVNRLVEIVSPESDRWTYSYDAAGNLIRSVDANGNATPEVGDGTTTFSYDELNRLTLTDYSDSTPDVSYAYDANGNRIAMADGVGSVSYGFDALDRLISATRGDETFTYVYDAAGNVTRRTYPNATEIHYTYDDDGRIGNVASAGNDTAYAYDAANNQIGISLPNGHSSEMRYDAAGRLEEIKNLGGTNVLSRFNYRRDGVANPLSITTPGDVTNYLYDALDRLTDVCEGGECTDPSATKTQYVYDAVGNRIEESDGGSVTSYSHDDDDELLQSSGAGGNVSYSHDANGNMTSAGSSTYTYDQAGRLTTAVAGGSASTYTYDGDGMRRSVLGAGAPTTFMWDMNYSIPQLALEAVGPTLTPTRSYIYGAGRIAMNEAGSAPHYYQHDGLGSVVGVSSLGGAEEWAYSYDAFGEAKETDKLSLLAPENPMRFTGEYLDPSGLYHLRARQLDAGLGRFLSRDPASTSLQDSYLSSYAYADNRPILLVDPTGLKTGGGCIGGHISIGGLQLGGEVCFVGDDDGNTGIALSNGGGPAVTAPLNAGAAVKGHYSDADTIFGLSGEFLSVGGSIGPVTADYFWSNCGVQGVEGGLGYSLVPAEGHLQGTKTVVVPASGVYTPNPIVQLIGGLFN